MHALKHAVRALPTASARLGRRWSHRRRPTRPTTPLGRVFHGNNDGVRLACGRQSDLLTVVPAHTPRYTHVGCAALGKRTPAPTLKSGPEKVVALTSGSATSSPRSVLECTCRVNTQAGAPGGHVPSHRRDFPTCTCTMHPRNPCISCVTPLHDHGTATHWQRVQFARHCDSKAM